MKRALQIAKELSVSFSTLQNYLRKIGQVIESPNERIVYETELLLNDIHNQKSNLLEGEHQLDSFFSKVLPIEFSQKNPFESEQIAIISSNDIFTNRLLSKTIINSIEFESYFTDYEAFIICQGLEDRHAKHIAREYFKNPQDSTNIIEAHEIAKTTYEKYGGQLLSYIISLPPLPFKAVNATQVFNEIDKRRQTQDFPILRIAYKNQDNQNEKIQISFYAETDNQGWKLNEDVLIVKNRTTRKTIMKISRNGLVIPESNSKQVLPVLQVFIRFAKNTRETLVNYGLETGECAICGRELTDSKSIIRGMGPVCYSQLY